MARLNQLCNADKELGELLVQRRLLRYEGLHMMGRIFPDPVDEPHIGWYTKHPGNEYWLEFFIQCELDGVCCLWVQGDCTDHAGPPELLDALEDLRDSMGLTPIDSPDQT